MNCDDIAWILDERRVAALSPFERADFDAHIARCDECAAQCRADEQVFSFRSDVPPLPSSLSETARQLHEARAAAALERRTTRRPVLIGSLLLLGAAATMFAGAPWSDVRPANR
jgi:anti-sigma factor RsiW